MKVSELREMSVSALNEELHKTLEESFKLRMKKSTGQLAQNHLLKAARQNIVRIKTVLHEKQSKGDGV